MTSPTNALAFPGYVAGIWVADPAESTVEFAIRQLVGKVRGRFSRFDGTIATETDLLDSAVTATVDLASIDTGNQKRDDHLRGPAFLNVEKCPTMSYHSTGLRTSDGGWLIDGDLNLNGVTRSVPLALTVNGFTGGRLVSFSATTRISRRDFGITIPMAAGGVVVADKISISLEIQAVRQA